jgi:hypothetical protein
VAPVQSPELVGRLVELLGDPYLPVHDAALAALMNTAGDEAKDAVIAAAVKLLDTPQARRRQDAAALLGAYRSNAGIDRQIAMLAGKTATQAFDEPAMAETVRALGLIGDARAREAVMDVVNRGLRAVLNQAAGEEPLAAAAVTEAIVAAARLGDKRVLDPARRFLAANPEMTPPEPRAASAWAIGQVGEAGDNAHASILTRIYDSQFDADETKFEAVKAMGRLRLSATQATLATAAGEYPSSRVRWIAAWSLWRLTGQEPPYTPPPARWKAQTAIEAIDATEGS